MGQDPGEVRREVEAARVQLGETVEAIAYRAAAPKRTKRRVASSAAALRLRMEAFIRRMAGRGREVAAQTTERMDAMGDKLQGKTEQLTGKAKEAVGNASDDKDMQREGKTEQAKGDLREAGGKVKDAVRDAG